MPTRIAELGAVTCITNMRHQSDDRAPPYGTTFLGSIRTIHSPVIMSFT